MHSLIEQYRRSNPTASVTEILQTEISLRSEFQRHPIVLRKESAKAEFDTSLQQVKDTIHVRFGWTKCIAHCRTLLVCLTHE